MRKSDDLLDQILDFDAVRPLKRELHRCLDKWHCLKGHICNIDIEIKVRIRTKNKKKKKHKAK